MTPDKLKQLLAHPEGTIIEYKKSQESLTRSVYASICAFLNRRGGHVVLGANNDGTIVGINPDCVQTQIDTLAKDMNNPQLFKPTYYLNFEPLDIDGKKVIYFYVPESAQGHSYKGVYYDRNQDGDFELRSTEQIANLFIRKSKIKTEDRVYPELSMKDLDPEAFEELRNGLRKENPNHTWLSMTDEQIISSADMIKQVTDEKTDQKSGLKTDQKSSLKNEQVIITSIKNDPKITIQELQKCSGLSRTGVKNILNKLKEKGIIRRIGPDKGGTWEYIEQ